MYKPWDLDIWDIIYAELIGSNVKWEWEILNILDAKSYIYPVYIKWINRKWQWNINIKYSEVIKVIKSKEQEELSIKPFKFINL